MKLSLIFIILFLLSIVTAATPENSTFFWMNSSAFPEIIGEPDEVYYSPIGSSLMSARYTDVTGFNGTITNVEVMYSYNVSCQFNDDSADLRFRTNYSTAGITILLNNTNTPFNYLGNSSIVWFTYNVTDWDSNWSWFNISESAVSSTYTKVGVVDCVPQFDAGGVNVTYLVPFKSPTNIAPANSTSSNYITQNFSWTIPTPPTPDEYEFQLYYANNGTLITSNVTTQNATSEVIYDNNYMWRVNAIYIGGNSTFTNLWNLTIDTIFPTIYSDVPTEDNSTKIFNYFTVNFSCFDTNLWGANFTIYNSTNGSLFTNETTNISTSWFDMNSPVNTVYWADGFYNTTLRCADDHTNNNIGGLKSWRKSGVELEFNDTEGNRMFVRALFIKKNGDPANTPADFQFDGYTHASNAFIKFYANFTNTQPTAPNMRFVLNITSEQPLVFRDSGIEGHFVWGNKYFFDFEDAKNQGHDINITIHDDHNVTILFNGIGGSDGYANAQFVDIDPIVGALNTKELEIVFEKLLSVPIIDSLQLNNTQYAHQDLLLTINHTSPPGSQVTEFVTVFHNYTAGNVFHVNKSYSFLNLTLSTLFLYPKGNYSNNTFITFQVVLTNGVGNSTTVNVSKHIIDPFVAPPLPSAIYRFSYTPYVIYGEEFKFYGHYSASGSLEGVKCTYVVTDAELNPQKVKFYKEAVDTAAFDEQGYSFLTGNNGTITILFSTIGLFIGQNYTTEIICGDKDKIVVHTSRFTVNYAQTGELFDDTITFLLANMGNLVAGAIIAFWIVAAILFVLLVFNYFPEIRRSET